MQTLDYSGRQLISLTGHIKFLSALRDILFNEYNSKLFFLHEKNKRLCKKTLFCGPVKGPQRAAFGPQTALCPTCGKYNWGKRPKIDFLL